MYMCVLKGGQILLTFMVVKEPLIVVRETLQHDTTVLSCQVILREREREGPLHFKFILHSTPVLTAVCLM